MATRSKADQLPVGAIIVRRNGGDLGQSFGVDVRGEGLDVAPQPDGFAQLEVKAGAAHALATFRFTAAPDGLGGTTFTRTVLRTYKTLHIDPAQGLSPFVPVALNISTASDIGVPLDGALPPLASVSVEVHYRIDVIPPA